MKLLRLKITDPKGFRSLQAGFEHFFRTEWELEKEQGFAPFVCAGPNGSGKSNLLEVLAAIFFQLEILRVRRSFLPDNFLYDERDNPKGFRDGDGIPDGFELDYQIRVPANFCSSSSPEFAAVKIIKVCGKSPEISWLNQAEFAYDKLGVISDRERDFLLPEYVLGYSSGENEILSLPFFKMRFVQFDEYWHALKEQFSYPGRPETRLAYLDSGFSQAILLCNLLFHDDEALKPFREDVGVKELKEFRIIIRRSIDVSQDVAVGFIEKIFGVTAVNKGFGETKYHPALTVDEGSNRNTINLLKLLEADIESADNFDPIVSKFQRCATCTYLDEQTDTLYLDYWVNEATRKAFRENFDFEVNKSPIALFQAFQVLLTLNLYSASESLKTELYQSDSHYVTETVPILASDERIMRFKFVKFSKVGVEQPVMLKSLSDGEHQLLHSLGLCLLFKNTNSLFLLDEPETHFNPDWRSNFVIRLHQCFQGAEDSHEMLVTTHTPFLISDSRPEKVLVFKKDIETGTVSVSKPEYNTLGASINKITMNTFGKRETIGGHAQALLESFRERMKNKEEDKESLITEINQQLGDSVEKVLLIKTILDSMESQS
ncbi:MAG: restriction system-associated AAA family ATPase [Proteobacteria bacterium]|nr:restriction system-associated AAA family ATPase [Pseudomonadota bacterium]MCG2747361.1 restriction system-associated AAA family ATPase [Desulfobulbaceae bacterium]